jgi:hypothetical protein
LKNQRPINAAEALFNERSFWISYLVDSGCRSRLRRLVLWHCIALSIEDNVARCGILVHLVGDDRLLKLVEAVADPGPGEDALDFQRTMRP